MESSRRGTSSSLYSSTTWEFRQRYELRYFEIAVKSWAVCVVKFFSSDVSALYKFLAKCFNRWSVVR
jgi:hypothetical protein